MHPSTNLVDSHAGYANHRPKISFVIPPFLSPTVNSKASERALSRAPLQSPISNLPIMVLSDFNGKGVGFGFGIGCGFGIGWGFGGMPMNFLGLGAGGGCGVGLGLGWGFGTAFGSQYRSSKLTFNGSEFNSSDQSNERKPNDFTKETLKVRAGG